MNADPPHERRVLLVDDDEDDFFFLSTLLQSHFPWVKLTVVTQSEKVRAYLGRVPELPHLIFLDMHLPGQTGLELLGDLRQQPAFNRIPIILWSGYNSPEDTEAGYGLGAASVILKDSSLSAMKQKVEGIFQYWFEVVRLP